MLMNRILEIEYLDFFAQFAVAIVIIRPQGCAGPIRGSAFADATDCTFHPSFNSSIITKQTRDTLLPTTFAIHLAVLESNSP